MLTKTKTVTLIQGVFDKTFFDLLKKNGAKDVFVLEGRPKLLAAKNSCRELLKRKMTPTLITDNMAGFLFYKDFVKEVWVAYQSKEKECVVCHIGALVLGVLGKKHKVAVYAYPTKEKMGMEGKPQDIFRFQGKKIAPAGIKGHVPLIECLPREYITKVYA